MAWSPSKNLQGESLASLRARVLNNPRDGSGWLSLAQTLAHAQPGPELRQAIEKSIELLPDEYLAWLLAGLELQHRQGPEAARNWLKSITNQRPSLVAPRLAFAQLLHTDKPEQAGLEFEKVIRDFPGDSRAHLLLAELLQNQGRLLKAGDHLEKALEIKPDVAENWAALALIRLAADRLDAAVEAASSALKLNQADLGARLTRADAYRQAAQWKQGLDDYRYIHESLPGNPFVLLGLGACLAGVGEFEQALDLFNKALEIKPDLVEAKLNIALVLASLAKAEESLSWLRRIDLEHKLPPALAQSARTAQVVLEENQQLLPVLEAAELTGELDQISRVLRQVPSQLDKADEVTRHRLEKMAEACKEIAFKLPRDSHSGGEEYLPYLEACLQCKLSTDLGVLAGLWLDVVEGCVDPGLPQELQSVLRLQQAIKDRKACTEAQVGYAQDEALVRYWHYRLLKDLPEKLPGQLKVAPNSLGIHRTTPPECLHNALRYLMAELRPNVPAGWVRGIFMYSAINLIHAFIDGNGRLARFFLNLENESAGMPVVLLFPENRREIIKCLDQAHYKQNFEPYREVLKQAYTETGAYLEKFHRLVEEKKRERKA